MRRGLNTRKAVTKLLAKHKHHFESPFECKSDDEDDNDMGTDCAEDVFGSATHDARTGPFSAYQRHSDDSPS